jgi:hypothetical protein
VLSVPFLKWTNCGHTLIQRVNSVRLFGSVMVHCGAAVGMQFTLLAYTLINIRDVLAKV